MGQTRTLDDVDVVSHFSESGNETAPLNGTVMRVSRNAEEPADLNHRPQGLIHGPVDKKPLKSRGSKRADILPAYPTAVVRNEPDMSEARRQFQHATEQLDLSGQYLGVQTVYR